MEQTPGLPPELQAPAADVVDSHAPEPSPKGRALRTAGIVATGVVAGALGVAVLQGGGSGTTTLTGAGGPAAGQLGGPPTGTQGFGQAGPGQSSQGQSSQGQSSQGQSSQGQSGPGQTGPGQGGPGAGFRGGGVDGETRVLGTVTAVSTSSISLRADDGTTTTVPVASTTEVVVDGARATIGDVEEGDVAMVHVVPSGSGTVAERVLVGVPGFGPPQGDPRQGDGTTGSASGTVSST